MQGYRDRLFEGRARFVVRVVVVAVVVMGRLYGEGMENEVGRLVLPHPR